MSRRGHFEGGRERRARGAPFLGHGGGVLARHSSEGATEHAARRRDGDGCEREDEAVALAERGDRPFLEGDARERDSEGGGCRHEGEASALLERLHGTDASLHARQALVELAHLGLHSRWNTPDPSGTRLRAMGSRRDPSDGPWHGREGCRDRHEGRRDRERGRRDPTKRRRDPTEGRWDPTEWLRD